MNLTKQKIILPEGFLIIELLDNYERKLIYRTGAEKKKAVLTISPSHLPLPPDMLDLLNEQTPVSMMDIYPLAEVLELQFEIVTLIQTIKEIPNYPDEQLHQVASLLKVPLCEREHLVPKCLKVLFQTLNEAQTKQNRLAKGV